MAQENATSAVLSEIPADHQFEKLPAAAGLDDAQIVQLLEGYRAEAEYARLAGPNSRDQTWLQHLDMYWNRYDFSKKAPWQAREVMPELPQYVDRFAAALRSALVDSERFYTVTVANDDDGDLADVIKKMMTVSLRRVARNSTGHPIDFLSVFEEIMKFGALMMNCAIVINKNNGKHNYTAIEPMDPYNVWFDPTGRNLYRIRRFEIDLHELQGYADLLDAKNQPLYNKEAIANATASIVALLRSEREKRTGTGQWINSQRKPVVVHEYLCNLVNMEGKLVYKNALCVVVNNEYLIRGPEENPFWHKRDWMVAAPVITVPLSPYGRSYVENFAALAKTFNELTNLLLDGVFTSAMKAFACVPSMLEDPSQIEEGVYPNVVFRLAEGQTVQEFLKEVNLGQLPADALNLWQALKKEMQEGAAFNEIALGQLAPKGRTSATEVGTAEQNSSGYIRSIASNIEVLFLEPLLDTYWKCMIQHLDANDEEMKQAIGEQWFKVMLKMKRKFCEQQITFTVRGVSSLVLKAQKLQSLMQLLQIVGSNPMMAQKFMAEISVDKLLDLFFDLLDVEKDRIEMSPREKLMQQIEQMQQAAAQGAAGGQPRAPAQPGQPQQAGPQPNVQQPAMGAKGGQRAPVAQRAPKAATRHLDTSAGGGLGAQQ